MEDQLNLDEIICVRLMGDGSLEEDPNGNYHSTMTRRRLLAIKEESKRRIEEYNKKNGVES
jgi:hypothetical protein